MEKKLRGLQKLSRNWKIYIFCKLKRNDKYNKIDIYCYKYIWKIDKN